MQKSSTVAVHIRVSPLRMARVAMVAMVAAIVVLAPRGVRAQSYLAPLVTPPSSVGSCQPTHAVMESRPDTARFIGHRLVIRGARPGERRQITVFINARHAMLYDDVTLMMARQFTGVTRDVLASVDTLGQVRGRRVVGESSFPNDAVAPHDTAALRRLKPQGMTGSSQAPLNAVEQTRVRQMAAWLLERCP